LLFLSATSAVPQVSQPYISLSAVNFDTFFSNFEGGTFGKLVYSRQGTFPFPFPFSFYSISDQAGLG
jgi:hypothetical protein